MRRLLQETWNLLVSELERKKAEHLAHVLAEHPKPDVVYSLESYNTIRALQIDEAAIWVGLPYVEHKPTKKNVAALRAIVEGFNPTLADVLLCYSYNNGYGRVSGALKLSEFLSEVRYALTQEQLLPKQRELAERYAPRDGYKPCDYCRTQRLERDLKHRTIFAQQYPRGQKVGLYCADEGCGGYDQMAHEG